MDFRVTVTSPDMLPFFPHARFKRRIPSSDKGWWQPMKNASFTRLRESRVVHFPSSRQRDHNVSAMPLQRNRVDRTPLEHFVAGIQGWEVRLRRLMACDKSQTDNALFLADNAVVFR
jgi:hypothetical protein